jgi:hypothetical protein
MCRYLSVGDRYELCGKSKTSARPENPELAELNLGCVCIGWNDYLYFCHYAQLAILINHELHTTLRSSFFINIRFFIMKNIITQLRSIPSIHIVDRVMLVILGSTLLAMVIINLQGCELVFGGHRH